ncbi:hypothetical protein ACFQH0_16115, partial [Frigoriflavimonas asaccharolytica]
VGRYQGKEVVIPADEIENLDSHDHLLFESEYRKKLMKNPHIVPAEVQGKEIPYGLWDTYRKKYSWKPVFKLPEGSVLDEKGECGFDYFNGESEYIFHQKFPLSEFKKNALPKTLAFSWMSKENKVIAANCKLNEDSVFNAFKEVFAGNINAALEIKVNIANTFFTVKLKGDNGKEIFIKTDDLEVFKIKQYK